MHTQEDNWEKELRAIELGIAGWMRNVYGFTDGDTVSMEEVETVIRQFWNDQEPFIKRTRQEAYEKGRNGAIEEAFKIEKTKWKDAVHCTCLGYTLVELAGGEDSEGGKKMEERLLALRAASAPKQT